MAVVYLGLERLSERAHLAEERRAGAASRLEKAEEEASRLKAGPVCSPTQHKRPLLVPACFFVVDGGVRLLLD